MDIKNIKRIIGGQISCSCEIILYFTELYGQPSWWGDGDSDYSYPHTSSFGNKETVHPVVASRKYSEFSSLIISPPLWAQKYMSSVVSTLKEI